MNKRKAFNFYRSFYDVYKELNEKQAKEFMDNLLAVEFLEKSIDEVVFKDKICSIVWSSIKHSIEAQIKGYAYKTGFSLENDTPIIGGTVAPYQQGEVQGEEEEKVQLQLNASDDANFDEDFNICWNLHSQRLKELTTKTGNVRRNSKKSECKKVFFQLSKKYSPEAISCIVRNDTLRTTPKEFLNLIRKSLDVELLKILNIQDTEVLNEALNSSDNDFLEFIEAIESQI